MIRRILQIIAILIAVPFAFACVVPESGMKITQTTEFCTDTFFVSGITVSGKDIEVKCNGAVLSGFGKPVGILIENSDGVKLSDCNIVGYQLGIDVLHSKNVYLYKNKLVRNQVGVRLFDVTLSATLNHDVSLKGAFQISQSAGNVLSLTNKIVPEKFCKDNFCNVRESSIDVHLKPQTPAPVLQEWVATQATGKSKKTLSDWVFGGFW